MFFIILTRDTCILNLKNGNEYTTHKQETFKVRVNATARTYNSMKLSELRNQLNHNHSVKLVDKNNNETEDISQAEKLLLSDNTTLSLDDITDFKFNEKKISLRVIIHCWLHRNSNAADYLSDCQEKNLINISFLQRNELIQWLSGKSDDILLEDSSKERKNTTSLNSDELNISFDASLQQTLSKERTLLDHNTSLRGSKFTNFGYLIKEAELKLVHSLKNNSSKKVSNNGVTKISKSSPQLHKDPIILIPSAASSIFTISNIKQFLEESQYIHPRDLPVSQNDLTSATKKFNRISKPVKFLIVNNTRLFTKPEYWDRVVAVFTTGHQWQFNSYQWSNPGELFRHCKGYYFHFTGDMISKQVEQWNVQVIAIDKSKRFRDIEVSRYFWTTMEKELLSRGYH